MSYEEIKAYRLGWKEAGPYDLNTAKKEILNIAEGMLLDYFYYGEDEFDYEPSEQEKIDWVKNNGIFDISNDGKYISFSNLNNDRDFNTMEWMILTKEEIKEREESFEDDEFEDDEF